MLSGPKIANPSLFRLCGRLSLRPTSCGQQALVQGRVSSAYAEDFH